MKGREAEELGDFPSGMKLLWEKSRKCDEHYSKAVLLDTGNKLSCSDAHPGDKKLKHLVLLASLSNWWESAIPRSLPPQSENNSHEVPNQTECIFKILQCASSG